MTEFENRMFYAMHSLWLAFFNLDRISWETDIPDDQKEAYNNILRSLREAQRLGQEHYGHLIKWGKE